MVAPIGSTPKVANDLDDHEIVIDGSEISAEEAYKLAERDIANAKAKNIYDYVITPSTMVLSVQLPLLKGLVACTTVAGFRQPVIDATARCIQYLKGTA